MIRSQSLAAAWAAVASSLLGCSTVEEAATPIGAAAGGIALVYEVEGEAALPLTVALAEREEGTSVVPAAFENENIAAGGDEPDHGSAETLRRARLEIRRVGGKTLARVTVYRATAGRRTTAGRPADDLYELEVPAAELTLAVDELVATGACSPTERPGGGARISLAAGDAVPKEWTPEPCLDDLADRVLRDGKRVPKRLQRRSGQARVTTERH